MLTSLVVPLETHMVTRSGSKIVMAKNVNMCNGWYGLDGFDFLHLLDSHDASNKYGVPYTGFGERWVRDPIGSLFRFVLHNVFYSFVLNGLFALLLLRPIIDGVFVSDKGIDKSE